MLRRILASALLLLLAGSCAQFEPLPPGEVQEGGRIEGALPPLPARERMIYRGTWNGVPAGEADLVFERKGEEYVCRGTLETIGVVSLLYGLSVRAESVADAGDLRSRRWSHVSDGSEPKRVEVRFDPDSGRVLCIKRQGETVDRAVRDAPEALDPIGTITAVRRTRLAAGTGFRSELISEWFVYRADVRVVGPERIEVPAGEFDTVFVRIDLSKMVDGQAEGEPRGIGIWLTNDTDRVPVRIDADTKIGRVRIALTHHTRGWPVRGAGASGP